MTLRELDAWFIRRLRDDEKAGELAGHECWRVVATLAEADGVEFLCPKCFLERGGPVGCHRVICWFRGKVPDALDPGPGRWTPSGTGLDDLTFVPGEPPLSVSVKLEGGCGWHGHVANGEASLA